MKGGEFMSAYSRTLRCRGVGPGARVALWGRPFDPAKRDLSVDRPRRAGAILTREINVAATEE